MRKVICTHNMNIRLSEEDRTLLELVSSIREMKMSGLLKTLVREEADRLLQKTIEEQADVIGVDEEP